MNKGCLISLSYVDFDSINRWHGKITLVMGGIINLRGLYTVILDLDYKPIIIVFMMLFLVILNYLYTLKCQKLTEQKLKLFWWNTHKSPLITLEEKKKLFIFGKKESFIYPEINCRICLCKSCADNVPKHIYTFFDAPTIPEVEEGSNADEDCDICIL